MKIEYPKHMYNSNGEWREVKNEAEKIELGEAWKESPADFDENKYNESSEDSLDSKIDSFMTSDNEGKKKRGRPAKVRE